MTHYKVTLESGKVFYAEIPEGKKLRDKDLNYQLEIWYENIEGGTYRNRGIEASKTAELPSTGINWISFHPTCLEEKPVSKRKKETISSK